MQIQKIEYLKNEKSFLDGIKNKFFIIIYGLSSGEKMKKKWTQPKFQLPIQALFFPSISQGKQKVG